MTPKETYNTIKSLLGFKSEDKKAEDNVDNKTALAATPPADANANADANAPADDWGAKYDALAAKVDELAAKVAELAAADMPTAMSKHVEALSKMNEGLLSMSEQIEAMKVTPVSPIAGKENKPADNKVENADEKPLSKTAETLKWRIKNGYSKPSTLRGTNAAN